MTLNELKYIVAVAQYKHFGRAAEACFISQPTLSIAVKKLESQLGVDIFERKQNEIKITPIGEQIIAQAQKVLEEISVIQTIAHQGRDQISHPLRIGAIYTVGPYLFPALLNALSEIAPQMPLIIEENYTYRLAEKLKQGELDAIFIALPFEQQGILKAALYEESFIILIPSSHPFNQYEKIRLEQLRSEHILLLGQGHCFRDQVIELCPDCFKSKNHAEKMQLEGSSLETIRYMVASGMGITILPCSAAGADRFSQRLVSIKRFADVDPKRTIALAWRKSFPRPKAIDALRLAVQKSQLSCVHLIDPLRRWKL